MLSQFKISENQILNNCIIEKEKIFEHAFCIRFKLSKNPNYEYNLKLITR